MANTAHADNNSGRREIWRVTIILSVLTIIELALGFSMIGMEKNFLHHFIKGVIIILMIAKAFYIVSYFMHLGHELRNLIMTIVVPLTLFVWFIGAFLYDGASFGNLREKYDPSYVERTTKKTNEGSAEGKENVKEVKPQPPHQQGQE